MGQNFVSGSSGVAAPLQAFVVPAPFGKLRASSSQRTRRNGAPTVLVIAAKSKAWATRQRGITIRKTIDCLIATFCMQSKHPLLHRDHDFEPFEKELGLHVVHPE